MICLLKICSLLINSHTSLGLDSFVCSPTFLSRQLLEQWTGTCCELLLSPSESRVSFYHFALSLLFREHLIIWKSQCLLCMKRLLLAFGRAITTDGVFCRQSRGSASPGVIWKYHTVQLANDIRKKRAGLNSAKSRSKQDKPKTKQVIESAVCLRLTAFILFLS